MRNRWMAGLVGLAIVGAMWPGVVAAGANTKDDLLDDFGPAIEHAFINFNQDEDGDLRIVVNLHKVPEGAASWYVEVWCGPDHATSGTEIVQFDDAITTNAKGNGNSGALWIPAAELTAACGSGDHTGHVDVQSNGSEYTSTTGGITFTAP